MHYWADLQLVHGFHCYDNIAMNVRLSLHCIAISCSSFYITLHYVSFSCFLRYVALHEILRFLYNVKFAHYGMLHYIVLGWKTGITHTDPIQSVGKDF